MKRIKEYLPALISVFWGILFILIFSYFTSPLFGSAAGSRVAILKALGRGMDNGVVMYRDCMDTRGPLFFVIQYLGEVLHIPGGGIILLQCCFSAVSALYLLTICKMHGLGRNKTIFVFVFTYILYMSALSGGDTAGEFVFLLALQNLYATLVYINTGKWSGLSIFIPALISGLAIMTDLRFFIPFLFFPGLVLFDMAKKGEKNHRVGIVALIYLSGLLMPFVFFCIMYFQTNALPHMLSAMISSLSGFSFGSLAGEQGSLLCYGGVLIFFIRRRWAGLEGVLLLFVSIITWVFLHMGVSQAGDGIMVLLPAVLMMLELCEDIRVAVMGEDWTEISDVKPVSEEGGTDFEAVDLKESKRLLIPGICLQLFVLAMSSAMASGFGYDGLTVNSGVEATVRRNDVFQESREIYGRITPGESIYYIDVDPLFYEANRTYPENRYLGEVSAIIARYPKAELDILTDLYPKKDGSSPRWIVQGSPFEINSDNIRLIMEGEYEEAHRTARFILWRRKK